MRKRDELSNPKSCLNKARDDEWLFVLLGRDLAAITAVRAWIRKRIKLGKNTKHDPQIMEAKAWIIIVESEQKLCQTATYSPKMRRKAVCPIRRGRGARKGNTTLRHRQK